ncbi:protein FRA10AC1 isoform X2 [Larimichthys crocea]|uniref:protein FRA10AC1 isoform X2 n=1 Tax=Larimichthys crocea TaxID=215358 RepID=UPI000F5E19DB|nr:protein FRA10AC1 isoform X2 [Larimichthys crocea]
MENLVKVHGGGGYDSDFSDDDEEGESSERGVKRKREEEILQKPFQKGRHSKVAHQSLHSNELDREEARNRRAHLISMNAFERHKKFVGDYILYYGGQMADFKRTADKDKTDADVLRENHRFLWRDEDEEDMTCLDFVGGLRMKLSLAKITEGETDGTQIFWTHTVESIKFSGQFQCGNKRCEKDEGLKSWEVNFAYVELGEKRNALVKLRLCPECSFKLNYHHKRKEVKAKTKTKRLSEENQEPQTKRKKRKRLSSHSKKHKHKHKRHRDRSASSSSSEESRDSDKDSEGGAEPDGQSEADHWRGPAPAVEEKSREEEFDEYFQDMFL